MSYATQLRGLLAEKKLKLKEEITRADGLVAGIHMQCSPHVPVDRLNADQIASQAADLEKTVYRIRQLSAEIDGLNHELGLDGSGA